MAGLNFDDRYEFDPRTYGGSKAGGLLEMLQRAMQGEALHERGAGYTPQPTASSAGSPDSSPGGVLGKWLALQAAAAAAPLGQISSAVADPNFRRLVRVA